GTAISFCGPDEVPFLRDIERLIRQAIPAETETGATVTVTDEVRPPRRDERNRRRNAGNTGRSNRGERRAERSRSAPGQDREVYAGRATNDVALLAAAAGEQARTKDHRPQGRKRFFRRRRANGDRRIEAQV